MFRVLIIPKRVPSWSFNYRAMSDAYIDTSKAVDKHHCSVAEAKGNIVCDFPSITYHTLGALN